MARLAEKYLRSFMPINYIQILNIRLQLHGHSYIFIQSWWVLRINQVQYAIDTKTFIVIS
jgi:hypothetical protein